MYCSGICIILVITQETYGCVMGTAETPEITYLRIIEKLLADKELTVAQRRAMISAVKCFVRCFEPRGLTAPVRPSEISQILSRATAARAGVGERSFSNMVSLLRRALLLCSIIHQPGRNPQALSAAWAALLPPPNTHARWRLSRFFHTATKHGWAPGSITADHFRIFHTELEQSAIQKKTRVVVKQAVREWNKLAEVIEGISPVEYRLLHPRPRFTLRWEEYPPSFRQELDTFYKDLASPSFLSEDDNHRPLRPASIKTLNCRLRIFAAALVQRGQNPAELTSLAQLCSFEAFKTGLSFLIDRAGGIIPQVLGVADAVYAVAKRDPTTDEVELDKLKKRLEKLRRELRRPGLSKRNIDKLAQFDVRRNRDAILQLPQRLRAIVKAERASGHFSRERAASLMLVAATVELLLMCPMRISNLASLDLEKHVKRTSTAKSISVHLHIPDTETKNGVEIHCQLPEQSARLLEEYINDYRPDLLHGPSTLLFPARNGGPRAPATFYISISRAVRRYAGVEMNPHLFRHLAAKFYLDENPGGYEVVRRTLGHKSMNTTVQFYAGQETLRTFRHYDEVIVGKRGEGLGPLRVASSRRRK
jgi:integrase